MDNASVEQDQSVKEMEQRIEKIKSKAAPTFQKANEYRESIELLSQELQNICTHPRPYLYFWCEEYDLHGHIDCKLCGKSGLESVMLKEISERQALVRH